MSVARAAATSEGGVTDVGSFFGDNVSKELETLEERGRVRLVLGGVLHGHKSVHDLPEAGKGVQSHLDAAFGSDDGKGKASIS
jgi:hypothetical protein